MTLADQEARDRVIHAHDATLFVEAGAGTGKTTALVGRVVALIANGVSPAGIAAITFTEKAAAELLDRVRQRLEQVARGEHPEFDEQQRRRCRDAIGLLDRAAFQTIHAFARKLLAEHPLQARLPPEFEVLDGTEEVLDANERVRRFLDELEADSAVRRPLVAAYALGLQPRHLRALALEFARNWDRLKGASFQVPAEEPDWEPPLADDLADVDRTGATESLTRHLAELEPYAERLAGTWKAYDQAREGEREARLADLITLAGRAPNIRTNVGRGKPLEAARQNFMEWRGGIARWALGHLLPRAQTFALEYADERRQAGRLTFGDLLVLAAELLREDVDVLRAVHERYPYLLIDEFQDTDPVQVELAALIASGPAYPGRWHDAHPNPGRLFFVGDPKQSIYRFRRADIGIYRRAEAAFGAEKPQLTTNFRSTRRIIGWVNAVCERLFDGAAHQAPWAALEPRPNADDGKPVRVLANRKGLDARQARELEAERVAQGVLEARANNWTGSEQGTRFADITILLPRRTGLGALERALADRGIPYRIESRSLLYATQDVRDLWNVLAAVDDPTDRIALVAALRSPFFACTDKELAEHARVRGRWSYLEKAPERSPGRVRAALETLRRWHDQRWKLGPSGMIELVLTERHGLLLALADRRPREAWRRYRLLAEQARALTVRGAVATLRQFIEWLEQQAAEGADVNEAIVPEPDDDAVRVMTVHAAKGLEFPVVFVMGLGAAGARSDGVQVWWPADPAGLPEVRLGREELGFETGGFRERRDEERQHEDAERVRLFYVAATRAKRALVVSLIRSDRDARGSIAEPVERLLNEGVAGNSWEWYEPAEGGPVAAGAPPPGQAGRVPPREAWLAERERLASELGAAPVAAATKLARLEEPEEPPAAPEEPWRRGRAGTSIGRAVHAVLQGIDLATGNGIDAAARAQAEAEGVPGRAGEVARLARAALESARVQEAARSGRWWREVYVGAEVDGVLIEGFIDLLYEDSDGMLGIIDYKTDAVRSAAEVDELMARYRLQGAAYAVALERALGRPVARVTFVFTEPALERDIDDLEAAMDAVRKLAREAAGAAPAPGER